MYERANSGATTACLYPAEVHESDWLPLAEAHADRVRPWVDGRLARRPRGEKNAIEDFLFDYYPYSPGRLATWHPGHGVVLEGMHAQRYLDLAGYRSVDGGVTADLAWLGPRRLRLDLAIRILTSTSTRPAMTGCFGLHEWAMVYGLDQEQVRHHYLPLRISPSEVAATVDAVGLRCTHIDAYRFFTPTAVPLNEYEPTRETQPAMEQPGCLHSSMDLYKYAFWFAPLVSSDLIADCFENAARARELDMRASPYDMTPFGLEAIPVETPEGRRQYAFGQQAVISASVPLRTRLVATLTALRDAADCTTSSAG